MILQFIFFPTEYFSHTNSLFCKAHVGSSTIGILDKSMIVRTYVVKTSLYKLQFFNMLTGIFIFRDDDLI